ncbi:hypothetical protein HSB1_33750 [Halogranum salarium B-1]|uniref:Uncharacterized protein n=1 Tax=Halogranum salarium B-1 TaxID=1210908 RepID=J2ZY57_9EURY|nr:hypothetical protein HSB1_33750 [Halogranum salarium B-1]
MFALSALTAASVPDEERRPSLPSTGPSVVFAHCSWFCTLVDISTAHQI